MKAQETTHRATVSCIHTHNSHRKYPSEFRIVIESAFWAIHTINGRILISCLFSDKDRDGFISCAHITISVIYE